MAERTQAHLKRTDASNIKSNQTGLKEENATESQRENDTEHVYGGSGDVIGLVVCCGQRDGADEYGNYSRTSDGPFGGNGGGSHGFVDDTERRFDGYHDK